MVSKKNTTSEILNQLVASSLDAVIAIDEQGHVSVFNEKAEKILGYNANDIIGKSIDILYNDIQEARKVGQIILKEEKISNLETFMFDKSGEKTPILLSASLLRDQSGKIIGQAGYIRDLRQTKLLEEKLKVLVSATTVVNNNLDLAATLKSIVTGIREALECDLVTLYIYDENQGDVLFPPAIAGSMFDPGKVVELGYVPKDSVVHKILSLDHLYIAKSATNDVLVSGRFVEREKIQSTIGIPLIVAERRVGVLFANYRTRHEFTSVELESITLFANQAAIAISNAQVYQDVQKRIGALESLYEASRVISSYIDLDNVLQLIVEQAGKLTSGGGKATNLSYISLYERDSGKLVLKATYPSKIFSKLQGSIGEIDLHGENRRGIAGRAVVVKQSNLTSDVYKDPDYINLGMGTRSELAVPIIVGKELIGVINVEHPEINAFDREDIQIIEALAAQAGIAIQNARRYEELKRTKGLIGARTALAWMGMASSTWRHSIEGKAVNIRNTVALMRKYLKTEVDLDDINSKLEMIERLAHDILERPITPPLESEVGLETFNINQLIETRTQRLREDISKSDIIFDLKLETNEPMLVWASPEWIRRGLDLLIENSIRAMASSSKKQLTISSSIVGDQIEILIQDTGKGISSDLKSKLFTEPIAKRKDEKGLGMGLLMAQTIFQTYGGNIQLIESNPSGTTFSINLPKHTSAL